MSEKNERFIILKKTRYSEADLIIHALGVKGNKKSFIAKSALKSKKRFGGGVLEPSHFVKLSYRDLSEKNQLSVLNEAELIEGFTFIRADYDKLDFALQVLNLIFHVSQEGDENSGLLFNLLGHTLKSLETIYDINVFKLHFYLKFLYQQGVIQMESWMTHFLKVNLSDSIELQKMAEAKVFADEYLISIESLVLQYIKTADI